MRLKLAGAALLTAGLALGVRAQGRSGDYGAWYLSQYGPAVAATDVERALLAEAEQVFAGLAAVADRRLSRPPNLLIIKKEGIEAQALPDGTIVINLGLLRLCLGSVPTDAGRARLAFVLGHELAHLAHDDSWHAEAFTALRSHPDARLRSQLEDWVVESADQRQGKELHADEAGFKYMAMAGHETAAVLGPAHDFLREWSEQAGSPAKPALADARQPSFAKRSQALRTKLLAISASVPYFRFGVRLVQLGRPDDALALLQLALSTLPSREVESNIGLAHYQRALARLAECGSRSGLHFLLPVALDPETLAARVQLRDSRTSECPGVVLARGDLSAARDALERALARDPSYLPARVNLVAVLLQQGEPQEAFGKSKEPGVQPGDPRLVLLNALALSGLGRSVPGDAADGALDRLEALEARCKGSDACGAQRVAIVSAATFNRARIQHERGRGVAAVQAWRRFLDLQPRGPWADEARAALRQLGKRAGGAETAAAVESLPSQRPSVEERLALDARTRLRSGTSRAFTLGAVRGAIRSAAGLEALELRGTIELVEERLDPALEPSSLEREQGAPWTVDLLEGGKLTWIYREVAYDIENGRVVRRVLFQGR